jgi:hypothetical protein
MMTPPAKLDKVPCNANEIPVPIASITADTDAV